MDDADKGGEDTFFSLWAALVSHENGLVSFRGGGGGGGDIVVFSERGGCGGGGYCVGTGPDRPAAKCPDSLTGDVASSDVVVGSVESCTEIWEDGIVPFTMSILSATKALSAVQNSYDGLVDCRSHRVDGET
jgi:hypothetical protein